jgi:hypothetical protein
MMHGAVFQEPLVEIRQCHRRAVRRQQQICPAQQRRGRGNQDELHRPVRQTGNGRSGYVAFRFFP